MTRKELKGNAKQQVKGNVGIYFLSGLIIFIVSVILMFIPFASFATILFMAPMYLGMAKLTLSITAGERGTISKVFEGFNEFGKSILTQILVNIFTFLWTLLLIIPGIIKGYSYSMVMYILAENPDISSMDAIRESQRIMKGHKWEYFVLLLSFILWDLLGIITLGLAFIYIQPYKMITIGNYYNYLKSIA